MVRGLIAISIATAIAGCGESKAKPYDSSDPVQCMTILDLASAGARVDGDLEYAREMENRQKRLMRANGGIDWLNKIMEESKEFGARLEREKDSVGLQTLLRECVDRYAG